MCSMDGVHVLDAMCIWVNNAACCAKITSAFGVDITIVQRYKNELYR